MPKVCCIIDCGSKYVDRGLNQRTIFAVPKDAKRRQAWLDAISPYLRKATKGCKRFYVCDLHFQENDILRDYSILLKNGSTHSIPRFQVSLSPSSVPSIFNEKNKVEDSVGWDVEDKKIGVMPPFDGNAVSDSGPEEDRIKGVTSVEQNVTGLISIVKEERTIVSQMFDDDSEHSDLGSSHYEDDRNNRTETIFVRKDLTTETRAARKVSTEDSKEEIMRLDDTQSLTAKIDKRKQCQGIDDSTPCPNDSVELSPKSSSDRCISCGIKRKQQLHDLRRVRERSTFRQKKMKRSIKNLKRQNARLLKTLASVKKKADQDRQKLAEFAGSSKNVPEKPTKN